MKFARGEHDETIKMCMEVIRLGKLRCFVLQKMAKHVGAWTKGQLFADNIFQCILVNGKFYTCILFQTLLKFVPEDPPNNSA